MDNWGQLALLQAWTPLIAAHAAFAVIAVVLGAFNALRSVRGDRVHRTVGRVWVSMLGIVAVSSFFIGDYTSGLGLFLHGLAAWTITSITVGVVAARRGAIDLHRRFMVGTYLGLLGAGIGAVAVPTRRVPSWYAAHPAEMAAITLGLFILAGLVIAAASTSHHHEQSGGRMRRRGRVSSRLRADDRRCVDAYRRADRTDGRADPVSS